MISGRRQALNVVDPTVGAGGAMTAHGGVRAAVRRLHLTDFRNYASLRLNTQASAIVLTGDNGAGKTNLLEALSFLAPGRGMRRVKPGEATRHATQSWAVAAQIETPDGPCDVGTGLDVRSDGREKRLVRIDGETQRAQTAWADVNSVKR